MSEDHNTDYKCEERMAAGPHYIKGLYQLGNGKSGRKMPCNSKWMNDIITWLDAAMPSLCHHVIQWMQIYVQKPSDMSSSLSESFQEAHHVKVPLM